MNTSISRLSGLLFSGSSLTLFFLLAVYQYYFGATEQVGWSQDLARYMDDWHVVGLFWGGEMLAVVLIAWSALNLAKRNRFWNLVAIGHLLLLVKYLVLLGGYPVVQSEELYLLLHRLTVVIFAGATLMWITGMAGLYAFERGWLKYIGTAGAMILGGLFVLVFSGGITPETMTLAVPLALAVYLLNVVYGIRVFFNTRYARR